jgi:hypothetical protein
VIATAPRPGPGPRRRRGARAAWGALLAAVLAGTACRRSFTSDDQRFASNVQAAVLNAGDGLDGELALAVCGDAARLGHRRAPLLRIAPDRYRDCAGASPGPELARGLSAARILLATCTKSGEELLVRDDLSIFARWPGEGIEGVACVGKCREAGCAPPCSESALSLRQSACGELSRWDGKTVPLRLEAPWPRP